MDSIQDRARIREIDAELNATDANEPRQYSSGHGTRRKRRRRRRRGKKTRGKIKKKIKKK
jgi:hypothetical protein